ncbi:MAG TPA: hypothetical protein VLJ59_16550 [Mycobacteriales bacterium]|nr:hypothetical protein [Mycobacteriales bacterium]
MDIRDQGERRWLVLRTLLALMLGLSLLSAVPRAAIAVSRDCQAEIATAQSVAQKIAAHNAKPHTFRLPAQADAYAAYNTEAVQLNNAKAAAVRALDSCKAALLARAKALEQAHRELAAGGQVRELSSERRAKIDAVRPSLSGYTPPATPAVNLPKNSPIARLKDALRQDNPRWPYENVPLQGKARTNIGDADAAYAGPGTKYPNRTIPAVNGEPAVTPDHIYPLVKLVQLPGFTRLTSENMWRVATGELNLQWMSRTANWSKGSRGAAAMAGVNPAWQDAQIQLEAQTEAQLRDLIQRLLANQ